MAMKLSEVEKLLDVHYQGFNKLNDYQKAYEQVLKTRKKEFDMRESLITKSALKLVGITEENYHYIQKLEMAQIYTLPEVSVQIRVDGISLPVSEDTEIEMAKVQSSADIQCNCWDSTRIELAKEFGLKLEGDKFYRNVYSVEGLLEGIRIVSKAAYSLKYGIDRSDQKNLELTRVPPELLDKIA